MPATIPESATPEPNVGALLVYGDWVVDEYWFLVRHQSDISSHTGLLHYRILTEPGEVIYALCGAGHVARVLYALRSTASPPAPALWGLGAWHSDDTDRLSHLVHSGEPPPDPQRCDADRMSFCLHSQTCPSPPTRAGVHLRNLGNAQHTVRVVRLYHQEGARLHQISRIDWEPKRASIAAPPRSSQPHYELPADLPATVRLVIVEDYTKGAVTPELVSSLLQRYPDARWHLRTKDKAIPYLRIAGLRDKLDLLVIGPEIASQTKPWDSWLSDDRLTSQALQLLREPALPNVVVLTDQREVIARVERNTYCVTGRSNAERNPLADIGWASAFFAALSWHLWARPGEEGPAPAQDAIEGAIKGAIEHADQYGSIKPPGSTGIRIQTPRPATVRVSSWSDEDQTWTQAMSGQGIIQDADHLYLDLWRASTNLPGYVTCVRKKQEVIDRIGRHIRRFTRHPNPSTALTILLQADPGSGKTFLAQSLAKAFNCSYLPFDITQMMHREELLSIFDAISALQAEGVRGGEEERPVLVLVDEINARLDADYTFSAFLAPLETGFYARHGRHVMLRPCVWLFAGTRVDPTAMNSGDKLSDFRSRMTLYEEIDFPSLKERYKEDSTLGTVQMTNAEVVLEPLYAEARLEQVYVGVSIVNKLFPDVRRLSWDVLYGFWKLDPETSPARILRRLTSAFTNVQYGVITKANWDCQYEDIVRGYIAEKFHKGLWLPPNDGERLVELRFRAAES